MLLIYSFLILSVLVIPHIYFNFLISVRCNLFPCIILVAQYFGRLCTIHTNTFISFKRYSFNRYNTKPNQLTSFLYWIPGTILLDFNRKIYLLQKFICSATFHVFFKAFKLLSFSRCKWIWRYIQYYKCKWKDPSFKS